MQASEAVPRLGWAAGVAALGATIVNLGATLYPLRFGSADWEVAAFGEIAATLAVPTLSLALLGAMGMIRGVGWVTVAAAFGSAVLAALATTGLILLGLDLPLVLNAARGAGPQGTALKLLQLKTGGLLAGYAIGLWVFAVYLLRGGRT